MQLMEKMIVEKGSVLPGDIVKVGSFLNQQIDPELLRASAEEIVNAFSDCLITKVLTIESSGIALAAAVALRLGVPMVFAKKHKSANVDGETYVTVVHSYTHGTDYTVIVSKDYIKSDDTVLLVDDFLANGAALRGLLDFIRQAGAKTAGAAVAIEKGFQHGGDKLREEGLRIESLAIIESMDGGAIRFRP